jgi:ribulose-5-phosphate 4-epimerase/fuculose-1-phosphate aldolase
MLCLSHLSYHDYEGVALDLDERERLIRDLGGKSMMMLRNHGVLTAGKDVAETFTYLYFLMKACEIQVKAQGCGPLHMPSEQAVRTTAEQSQSLGSAAALTWPALLRLLDSKNSGYAV